MMFPKFVICGIVAGSYQIILILDNTVLEFLFDKSVQDTYGLCRILLGLVK